MARKTGAKAQTVNVQISPNSAENEAEIEQSPESLDIDAALEALPEGSVAVLRRLEPNGDRAFIEQTAPSAMDEARIASHGAGTYIVQFRGPLNDGTRKIGYKGQRRVVIGESAARAALTAIAPTPPNAGVPNGGSSLMDQLAGGMLVGMIQQMQQLSSLQAQQAREHSTAMMTMLGKIAERPATDPLLTALLPALLEKRADPIDQATRIAEIASKGSGARAGTTEVLAALELVEKIREMGGDGGGGGKSDGGWVGMIRDALPLVLRGNQQPATVPGPVAVVEPPNGTAIPQATNGQPQPNAMPADYLTPIYPHLTHIENAALMGTAPETAADFFVSFIPAGHYPMLFSILDRSSVVSDIVERVPSLAIHEKWLTVLVRELRAHVAPDDGEGDGDGDGDDAKG